MDRSNSNPGDCAAMRRTVSARNRIGSRRSCVSRVALGIGRSDSRRRPRERPARIANRRGQWPAGCPPPDCVTSSRRSTQAPTIATNGFGLRSRSHTAAWIDQWSLLLHARDRGIVAAFSHPEHEWQALPGVSRKSASSTKADSRFALRYVGRLGDDAIEKRTDVGYADRVGEEPEHWRVIGRITDEHETVALCIEVHGKDFGREAYGSS